MVSQARHHKKLTTIWPSSSRLLLVVPVWLNFLLWRWRSYIAPNLRTPSELRGITTQKTVVFISQLFNYILFFHVCWLRPEIYSRDTRENLGGDPDWFLSPRLRSVSPGERLIRLLMRYTLSSWSVFLTSSHIVTNPCYSTRQQSQQLKRCG